MARPEEVRVWNAAEAVASAQTEDEYDAAWLEFADVVGLHPDDIKLRNEYEAACYETSCYRQEMEWYEDAMFGTDTRDK